MSSPWRTALRHRKLVRRWISIFRVPQRLHEDAEQEGMIALVQAAERWDPSLSSFVTYASLYLRAALCGVINSSIAADGLTSLRGYRHRPRARVEYDDDVQRVEDEHADHFELAWLRLEIAALTPHEWQVMTRRYVLGRSQLEVAGELGVSRARIGQIEARSIAVLQSRVGRASR